MAVTGPTTDQKEIREWAKRHQAVPVEVLPDMVDSKPALLRIMLAAQTKDLKFVRVIPWEEFFVKFDALGLAMVYDNDSIGYNELLQVEDRSPTGIRRIRRGCCRIEQS